MTSCIRILLADDHALLREGTRHALEKFPDMKVVVEASDGEQALRLCIELRPDVAILDLRMPKLSGIEVVRSLRGSVPGTRPLILTAYDNEEYVLEAMQAGASGYLLKTTRPSDLADAIRQVQAGEVALDPIVAAKMARLWARHRSMTHTERAQELSPREREIVQLCGQGLRNKAIADKLGISTRTVETHFNSIFAKLNVRSRLEVALYAASSEADGKWEKNSA